MNKEIKIVPPEGYDIDKENSTFECIKFKPIKKELPKTWEEFCETHPIEKEYYIGSASGIRLQCKDLRFGDADRNLLPSKELAEAMLALCQLIQLRDCYNDEWKPDWTDAVGSKYAISSYKGTIIPDRVWATNRILTFKTSKLRDQFLKNFYDLIEIAKPLL